MGYVLPVQLDGYLQYANRMNTNKQYVKLHPVQKAAFYRIDSQYSHQEIQKNNRINLFKTMKKEEERAETNSARLLAEITGKGRYVDEYV